MRAFFLLIFFSIGFVTAEDKRGYPESVKEVRYRSSGDGTEQPALFWQPESSEEKVPLLVALHTWSGDYQQTGSQVVFAEWCQQVGWAFIHPNFRGQNWTPDALGSDLAVADIVSAVDFAKSEAPIDTDRIYCVGVSGGGHASLLMAGRHPELWAGVSAWCGIAHIALWHAQCRDTEFSRYSEHIEKALGGPPNSKPRRQDAQHRSPVKWLSNAQGVNLDINHGVTDGRSGSVPFNHSFLAWNEVVIPEDRFSAEGIAEYYDSESIPEKWKPYHAKGEFPLFGKDKQPLFRRTSGSTRLTIFDGGHEIVHEAALNWLAAQRKGEPPVWDAPVLQRLKTGKVDGESGK